MTDSKNEQEVFIAKDHVNLESEFTKLCLHNGYQVADLSYHHNLPYHTKKILRGSNDHSSLSVRLRPDLFITKDGKSMLCELKTGNSKDVLRVEAYQLMLNKLNDMDLHVPCLYVYRGKISEGKIIACRSKDIAGSSLTIPDKKGNAPIEETLLEFYEDYPLTRVKVDYPYSGDPFITISAEEIKEKWEPIDKFIN